MKKIFRNVPNFLTLCNLLSGCAGIILVFRGNILTGASMIWIGAGFDFLDGFSARLLKAYSGVGKELDSLADMVTFGILPACLMYMVLSEYPVLPGKYFPCISLVIPVFSALRLAKFNLDERQKYDFIGLPTPANAFLLSGIPFINDGVFLNFTRSPMLLATGILFGSLLMVTPFHFPSLKFRNLDFLENIVRILILLIAGVFIWVYKLAGITPVLLIYIVLSLLNNLFLKQKSVPGK